MAKVTKSPEQKQIDTLSKDNARKDKSIGSMFKKFAEYAKLAQEILALVGAVPGAKSPADTTLRKKVEAKAKKIAESAAKAGGPASV